MRTILYFLFALYFILSTGLFLYFHSSTEAKIDELGMEMNKKIESEQRLASGNSPMLQIPTVKRDRVNVIIEVKEFDKINSHIKYLTDEVQKQYSITQSLIDNDINRLNLFITIGIGFLGFIGVFVPILTNLVSSNDFAERLVRLEGSATSSTKKIDEVNQKTENALPVIEALKIQNSFSRFVNMSPYLIIHLKRVDGKKYFMEILTSIKCNFEDCLKKDKQHLLLQDSHIKTSIIDFKVSIDQWHYITGLHSRAIYSNFIQISGDLKSILSGTNTDTAKIGLYQNVVNELTTIISQLKKP